MNWAVDEAGSQALSSTAVQVGQIDCGHFGRAWRECASDVGKLIISLAKKDFQDPAGDVYQQC